MRGMFQGAVWLLALLALMADSVKKPDVWNTLRFSCESKIEDGCDSFHVYGDRYIDGAKGREFLQLDDGTSPHLILQIPGENLVSSEDLYPSGIPDLWYYKGSRIQDIETDAAIIRIVINSYNSKPEAEIHCQYLVNASADNETNTLRNIVLIPGYLAFEATDHEGIKLYNDEDEIIATTQEKGYLQFAREETLARITIPGNNKNIVICSDDLDHLRERLKFEVEEP